MCPPCIAELHTVVAIRAGLCLLGNGLAKEGEPDLLTMSTRA